MLYTFIFCLFDSLLEKHIKTKGGEENEKRRIRRGNKREKRNRESERES
ncbi:hypothetical protein BCD_1470 (plasmid) [Borrelia crocidurae DOU]|uniref:Uncharacterized protein n=1 Tax=Borrelia crocidurae DOU TaxID=1293575 RepID=W5SR32_9SPIR|nr:hypothetical protein BCD_1470 [Borrelia crocidurae DOU]